MRDTLDRAFTPDNLALAIVDRMVLWGYLRPEHTVWEMHAGSGAFVRALAARLGPSQVVASDIDPDAPGLRVPGVRAFPGWDALRGYPIAGEQPDWTPGNPPFARHTGEWKTRTKCKGGGYGDGHSLCKACDGTGKVPVMETIWHEHVDIARKVARVGVAFLLRMSFLEPVKERAHLVNAVSEIWPVTPRPSYSGPTGESGGTDNVGPAVFLWRNDGAVPGPAATTLRWER